MLSIKKSINKTFMSISFCRLGPSPCQISNMQVNDNFYTNNVKYKCLESVCFAGKEIYPEKVIFCLALSNRGRSKPL